ncbi:cation:proton antiporter [Piscicoccus intestinalis]|uniref:cation:proton antiporter n=1 Tax=Piscicoccus intestinalis TaxID=746033 RepID=UPI001FDF5557|nr:monovalent cation/H(+) antiporter subunit G [Piscicoccus intestinalis]
MIALDVLAAVFIAAGCVFFTAGTVGIWRFGDLASRLHALTKADNLGLGLLLVGLMLQADTLATAAKLALVWLFAVFSSALGARLLAAGVLADSDAEATSEGRPS